jgi:hypothetical protein
MDMKLKGMGNDISSVAIEFGSNFQCLDFINRSHAWQSRIPGQVIPQNQAYLQEINLLCPKATVIFPLSARMSGDPLTGLVCKYKAGPPERSAKALEKAKKHLERLKQGPNELSFAAM